MKRIIAILLLITSTLLGAFGLRDIGYMGNVSTVLNVSASLPVFSGEIPWDAYGEVYFPPVQVFVWGGAAPYTYAWTHVSGDVYTATQGSNKYIEQFKIAGPYECSAVYRCTVTDARGNTITQDISLSYTVEPPP